jgi:ABC-type sugar transport system permease subunit
MLTTHCFAWSSSLSCVVLSLPLLILLNEGKRSIKYRLRTSMLVPWRCDVFLPVVVVQLYNCHLSIDI